MQSVTRLRGESYSTYAVFKNFIEADEAFKKIEGHQKKVCVKIYWFPKFLLLSLYLQRFSLLKHCHYCCISSIHLFKTLYMCKDCCSACVGTGWNLWCQKGRHVPCQSMHADLMARLTIGLCSETWMCWPAWYRIIPWQNLLGCLHAIIWQSFCARRKRKDLLYEQELKL